MKTFKNFRQATIYFCYGLLGIVLLFTVMRAYQLCTDENYYGFPAVTQCRVCDKTIWEWQSYERREFTVKNNGNFNGVMSASGLVHKHCKGNPIFECEVYVK